MSVAITGASGHLGRLAAAHALERIGAEELVLITRSPEALAELEGKGVDVRHGDFDDASTLPAAFAGVDRLLLISTDVVGTRVPQHKRAIAAAAEAGVTFVAYTSYPRPSEDNPAGVAAEHRATEQILRDSGLQWCFLRNSVYAELEAANLAAAKVSGQFVTNSGEGEVAFVARDDCAAAAAAVLTGGEHAGQAYDITGPELLDAAGRAAVFAELLGSPVAVVDVDDDAFAAGVAEATGQPLEVGQLYASFGRCIREGYLDLLTPTVRDLTGREPRTLLEALKELEA